MRRGFPGSSFCNSQAPLPTFSGARDRYRMAETTCRGEASGAAGQARGAKRLEPDRRTGGGAKTLLTNFSTLRNRLDLDATSRRIVKHS